MQSDLQYTTWPASCFFQAIQAALDEHIVPIGDAHPGDLVGVQYFTFGKDFGLDTWPAREFLILNDDGKIGLLNFKDLSKPLQADAALMAMNLLDHHPEYQSSFEDVATELIRVCPDPERKKEGDMIYGITLLHGAALVCNNEGGAGEFTESHCEQETLDRYARVLRPMPDTAHEAIEIASLYSPLAIERMEDAFRNAGSKTLFPNGMLPPRLAGLKHP